MCPIRVVDTVRIDAHSTCEIGADARCDTRRMVRIRRTLGAAVAAALGAAVLSGCGSSLYSDPNLVTGRSAQQLQAHSHVQARKLTSFAVGLDGTIAVAAQPKARGNSALAPLFEGSPIPIAGTGPVVPPDQSSLGLTVSIAGTHTRVTLIQTGGHRYAVALGRNILLPGAHATTDLQRVIVGLIHTMTAPTLGSTSHLRCDGTAATCPPGSTARSDAWVSPPGSCVAFKQLHTRPAGSPTSRRVRQQRSGIQQLVGCVG